jgi:hypothetical protein
MWTRRIPSHECVRAREWASLRLDAQLSDFESVLLDAHLVRCPECRAFAASVTGLTGTLRGAPLEEASIAIQVPRRSGARIYGLRAASAAAVVAAVGLSGLVGLNLSASRAPSAAVGVDRAVMGLKERQLERLDTAGRRARAIPLGLAAAEQATVGGAVAITAHRPAGATKTSPASG